MTAAQPCLVLVVDDDARAADMMARSLQRGGYDARTAYGGREALEAMAELAPRVMIIDLDMPAMSGEEVAREARRHAEAVVLIALSGVRGEARGISETDFDYYLRKPVAAGVVLDLVGGACRHGRDAL